MAVFDVVRNPGEALIEIFRADGSVETLREKNLVVNAGLEWIAARMNGESSGMSHMALGSNGAETQPWYGTLVTETAGTRVAISTSRSGAITTYKATFGPGVGTGTVAELGIFNAASGGTMLNRVAFTPQQKGSQDTFKVTWSVTQLA